MGSDPYLHVASWLPIFMDIGIVSYDLVIRHGNSEIGQRTQLNAGQCQTTADRQQSSASEHTDRNRFSINPTEIVAIVFREHRMRKMPSRTFRSLRKLRSLNSGSNLILCLAWAHEYFRYRISVHCIELWNSGVFKIRFVIYLCWPLAAWNEPSSYPGPKSAVSPPLLRD